MGDTGEAGPTDEVWAKLARLLPEGVEEAAGMAVFSSVVMTWSQGGIGGWRRGGKRGA